MFPYLQRAMDKQMFPLETPFRELDTIAYLTSNKRK